MDELQDRYSDATCRMLPEPQSQIKMSDSAETGTASSGNVEKRNECRQGHVEEVHTNNVKVPEKQRCKPDFPDSSFDKLHSPKPADSEDMDICRQSNSAHNLDCEYVQSKRPGDSGLNKLSDGEDLHQVQEAALTTNSVSPRQKDDPSHIANSERQLSSEPDSMGVENEKKNAEFNSDDQGCVKKEKTDQGGQAVHANKNQNVAAPLTNHTSSGSALVKSEPRAQSFPHILASPASHMGNLPNPARFKDNGDRQPLHHKVSGSKETDSDALSGNDSDASTSAATTVHSPTKILTKYVFISKPLVKKCGKRSFGLLYRQAFRHFYSSKVKGKIGKKTRQKANTQKSEPVKVAKLSLTNCKLKGKHRGEDGRVPKETEKPSSSKRQKREVKKSKGEASHTRKEKVAGPLSGEEPKKKRVGRRQPLALEEKLAIIEAMEKSNTSVASVSKDYEVSRSNIWKIMKKKDEILVQAKKNEELGSNRKKKKTKKDKGETAEKQSVEIKQEIHEDVGGEDEDDDDENDAAASAVSVKEEEEGGGASDNMRVFFSDIYTTCPPNKKSQLRNRRDLTLEEKVQVIKCLEAPGARVRGVARVFGVSSSAISRINKNKEFILLRSVSGDSCANERRSRDCKDPELDRALLRWYRAIEHMQPEGTTIAISNVLLKGKVHDLAITMGKDYFPSDNWIVRWKHRHNIGSKPKSSTTVTIQNKEELKTFDDRVDINDILKQLGKEAQKIDQVKREAILKRHEKPEEFIICEHCGVLTSSKKKKQNNHVPGCPSSSSRKDLTLEEKYQVVRALEQPGMKMITLAKKYGVSTSAISRINKNRIDILARRSSGLANGTRRRDRGSKEPEVERVLCEWFKVQNELGIHISGSMIRDKAREIAKVMGKDFWPSESWVFRWRHRNNVTDMNPLLYGDSDEEEEGGLERNNDTVEDVAAPNSSEEAAEPVETKVEIEDSADNGTSKKNKKRKGKTTDKEGPGEKRFRLPRSVMCEKCGFVSVRVKNKRIKSLRHAKGCPDQKPRNELTYENRAKILKALEEPGATLSSVAREFGISVSSMSRMNQQRERIMSHGQDHGGQKRIRDCKEPEVAYNLYRWYMEKKAEGIHVTGPKLKERAKKFAAEMGREFNASSGWLGRWRHRYNIIGSSSRGERIQKNLNQKKRKVKRNSDLRAESPEHLAHHLHSMPNDMHQDSLGSQTSVMGEPLDPVPAPQPTAVFLHQRFQNPWDLAQQQPSSCVWTTKEFLGAPGPSTQEEPMVPVSYAYSDAGVPKPMFHNMFDSFSVGYQVGMPMDSSMVGRDYLKTDTAEETPGGPVPHLTHKPHPSHQHLSHHHRTNHNSQPHLQHHPPLPALHPHSNPHQPSLQPQPQTSHPPLPSPSPALDEDPEQQRQIMEAFKIMSSFAAKKSLGGQVQAALKTIEMSMKNSSKKPPSRHTYTSI